MHLNGLGVKTNMQQALNYFASAAKYGHVLAQYNLAMLHLQNSATDKCAYITIRILSPSIHLLQGHLDFTSCDNDMSIV